MKKIFACMLAMFLFTAITIMGHAEEKIISGKVTAVNAKAGSVKIKGSDGKEVSFKGTEEQLNEIKVNDEVEATVDDGKIIAIFPISEEELLEESPK